MATGSTAPDVRQLMAARRYSSALRSLLGICGSMIALFGVVLATISAFADFDGGDFFLFAGFGLIASGALLAKRHAVGAWTYMAVFTATLAWSLHDSGLGGSPLEYRVAGPIIMLGLLALLMPALFHWSRRRTVSVLAALIMATVIAADISTTDDRALSGSNVTGPPSRQVQAKGSL